ncbi:MAG TPA: SRPBCC family protein [Mycobacteriales bacterium]|jgi:carbon monoxide dehydrogenase subunit G|nr:SRPBCC family protein [Mycobacteriales bacterium]
MQLENSFTVPVPADVAWRVLLDVERVAPCMPGATLDSVDGDTSNGRVKVKVGPITVTYKGTATFIEKDEAARRAVIEGAAKESRGSGTAKATVTMTMHEQGDQTEVKVVTDLNVTGKPAQFGRGVMADVSAKLIQQFADCLSEEIQASGAEASESAAAERAPAEAAAAEPAAAATAAAPVDPAPAPATPISRVSDAAAPTGAPTGGAIPTSRPQPRRSAEAIDLFETAGAPVVKRLLPVAGVAAVLALLFWLVRRR